MYLDKIVNFTHEAFKNKIAVITGGGRGLVKRLPVNILNRALRLSLLSLMKILVKIQLKKLEDTSLR